MEEYHIARKFVAIEGGARHYYEEGVFNSYDTAYNFIKQISEEEDDIFLSEIVSYPLNSGSPCDEKKVVTFDRKGNLILKYDATKIYDNCHVVKKDDYKIVYKNPEPESFTDKFKVGDFVLIKAFPWNAASPTCVDTIGVIVRAPVFFDEWVANGNDKYEWDNEYVVDYIRNGYLGHWHVQEKGLKIFNRKLPENLKFLKLLENHYLKRKEIPEESLSEILDGNIFIENVKCFFDGEYNY